MYGAFNQIVDYVAVARSTSETIEELLNMGFTSSELLSEFGFSKNDLKGGK